MNTTPDDVAQRSGDLFNQGLCCAESVLQAFAESRGIQSELIPKIATGLCAGIARSGDICGAVSGGVLAISLVTGRCNAKESREENNRLVRAFLSECEAKFGSTNCEKLIGCRLDTPEGQRFFNEHNLREKCAGFTCEAARLACRLIGQSSAAQVSQVH
jgi:C_GCAxxG_C_C family probable redox protein